MSSTSLNSFCRATLCIARLMLWRVVHLSVRLSVGHVRVFYRIEWTYPQKFLTLCQPHHSSFSCETLWRNSDGVALTGVWIWKLWIPDHLLAADGMDLTFVHFYPGNSGTKRHAVSRCVSVLQCHSRSSKVIQIGTNRKPVWDFLLVANSSLSCVW